MQDPIMQGVAMFKFLRMLFLSELGETPGQAPAAPEGQPPAPDANTDGQAGQGSEPPAQPKYGEFGDDPDKVWEAFNQTKSQFDQLRGKTSATERNLASLRKTLDASGIQVVSDDEGNIKLLPKQQETTKRRFTDAHKSLFDDKVLSAIELRVQDLVDEALEGYSRKNQELSQQQKQFIQAKNQANGLMVAYFPQLMETDKAGNKNAEYNEAFYNRATEIWQERYPKDPRGELIAALEAAKELNILPQMVSQAKKEGYEQGKADKKILSPVQGTSSKSTPGFKQLEKADYLKLDKEAREKYDKQLLSLGG